MKATTRYDDFPKLTEQIVEMFEYLEAEIEELKEQVDELMKKLKTNNSMSGQDKTAVEVLRDVHNKSWSE